MQSTSASDGTLHADRDLRDRHRSRLRPGAGAEPGRDRACRAAAGGRRCRASITQKKSTAILQIVTLTSPDGRYDSLYLAQLRDHQPEGRARAPAGRRRRQRLRRRPVQHAHLARSRTSCKARGLTPAGRDQRAPAAEPAGGRRPDRRAAGAAGPDVPVHAQRARPPRRRRASSRTSSSRPSPATAARSRACSDVGRVELGAQTYGQFFTLDGQPVGGHRDLPAAGRQRARRRATGCSGAMSELSRELPAGADLRHPVRHHDLRRAPRSTRSTRRCSRPAILVLIVILVFLQDWRATLVPGDHRAGHHHRRLRRHGGARLHRQPVDAVRASCSRSASWSTTPSSWSRAPRTTSSRACPRSDAAIRAMDELFGPIIGITLVLMAVFMPAAFLPGSTGQHLPRSSRWSSPRPRCSAPINAATLKPTQCALWLRRRCRRSGATSSIAPSTGSTTRAERGYVALVAAHGRAQRRLVIGGARPHRRARLSGFTRPADRLPADRGPGLPDRQRAAARRRLARAHRRRCWTGSSEIARKHARRRAGRHHRRHLGARRQRVALQRRRRLHHPRRLGASAAAAQDLLSLFTALNQSLGEIEEATASWCCRRRRSRASATPPAATMQVAAARRQLRPRQAAERASRRWSTNAADAVGPAARRDRAVPRDGAAIHRRGRPGQDPDARRVTVDQVFQALGGYLGSTYVDQFNKFGRTFQIYVQADAQYRAARRGHQPAERAQQRRRHDPARHAGRRSRRPIGPSLISLYNLYPSATIIGAAGARRLSRARR